MTVETLKMLDRKGENEGYGQGAPQGGYNEPAPGYGQQPQQPAQSAPQPQSEPKPAPELPEIDINEDDIPF